MLADWSILKFVLLRLRYALTPRLVTVLFFRSGSGGSLLLGAGA